MFFSKMRLKTTRRLIPFRSPAGRRKNKASPPPPPSLLYPQIPNEEASSEQTLNVNLKGNAQRQSTSVFISNSVEESSPQMNQFKNLYKKFNRGFFFLLLAFSMEYVSLFVIICIFLCFQYLHGQKYTKELILLIQSLFL